MLVDRTNTMENGAVSRSMNDTPCQNGEGGECTYVVSLALDSPGTLVGVSSYEIGGQQRAERVTNT